MALKRVLRGAVNVLTAAGVGLSSVAVLRAFEGRYREAWFWMGAALLIDLLDGPAVRVLRLQDYLPRYDGDRLDEYTDLAAFAVAPICFAWAADVLPATPLGITTGVWVCTVSSLQFSRQHNKTGEAFLGWPAYWNVLIFYGWGLALDPGLIVVFCWVLGFASFVPVSFIHPVRFPPLRSLTLLGGALWVGVMVLYLLVPGTPRWVLGASLVYPVYYFGLSLWFHERLNREQNRWEPPDRKGYNA